jgi:hypothetical protein
MRLRATPKSQYQIMCLASVVFDARISIHAKGLLPAQLNRVRSLPCYDPMISHNDFKTS